MLYGAMQVSIGGPLNVLRAVTDEVMYKIMKPSGQDYPGLYATAARRQIAEAAKASR